MLAAEIESRVDKTIDAVPSLREPGVKAHVLGDVETSPLGEAGEAWNKRLASQLRGKGIEDVTIVSEGRGKDVYLGQDGTIGVFDFSGELVHHYEPPHPEAAPPTDAVLPTEIAISAREPSPYAYNVQQIADLLAPSSRPREEAAETAAHVMGLYDDFMMQRGAEERKAPYKAETLSYLLPAGSEGLEALAYIIQSNHPALLEIMEEAGNDKLVRTMLYRQLTSVIDVFSRRLARQPANPRNEEIALIKGTLLRRKERFEQIRDQLHELSGVPQDDSARDD